MALFESGEMYLETILILSRKNEKVRAIDVGEYMGFSKPSVSRAIGNLKEEGYITLDEKKGIILTEKGKNVAEKVFEKHEVLTEILKSIGVSDKVAEEDACKMEHVISEETFTALKNKLR